MVGKTRTEADAVSFDRLVRDEQLKLLRFAYLVCGDHDLAEDVVAEVLARIWARWHEGVIDAPPAYVRRAIVNEIRGRARRAVVRRRHDDRRRVEAVPLSIDESTVEQDVVRIALQRLPVRQRAAVVLRYYEDRSEQETAELLGVSTGTVKTHVHRALEHLRQLLEEET